MPLTWLSIPTRGTPLDFPLPEPYTATYRDGAPWDPAGLVLPGRNVQLVAHGDFGVDVGTSADADGQVSQRVALTRNGVFGSALVDWFQWERYGTACDMELVLYHEDDGTEWLVLGSSPLHASPYIVEVDQYGEADIDLAKGKGSIGQINLTVLDKRRMRHDQASGLITYSLSDEEGRPYIIGRRAVLRRFTGTRWIVLMNGIVLDCVMHTSFVGWRLILRDFRDLERKAKFFPIAGTSVVFPRGVRTGYGKRDDGTWMAPPVVPWEGRFFTDAANGPRAGHFLLEIGEDEFPSDAVLTEQMAAATEDVYDVERARHVYPNVEVWWRPRNTSDPWTVVKRPGAVEGAHTFTLPLVFLRRNVRKTLKVKFWQTREQGYEFQGKTEEARKIERLYFEVPTVPIPLADNMPQDGQWCEFMVVYAGAPSEDYPYHWEGTLGEALVMLYDGLASSGQRYHMPFNRDKLLELTQRVRMRLTAAPNDGRRFIEEHFLQAVGGAPAWMDDGSLEPVFSTLPDAADVPTLPMLDDSLARPQAGYKLLGSKAVNRVNFTYFRDVYLGAAGDPHGTGSGGDGIYHKEVRIEWEATDSVYALEEKAYNVKTEAFCSLGDPHTFGPLGGDVTAELGYQLSVSRRDELFSRYRYASQLVAASCSYFRTASWRVGTWVRHALSWDPNLRTRLRGAENLAQIVSVKDDSCGEREVTAELLYVDPGAPGLPAPPPRVVDPWLAP